MARSLLPEPKYYKHFNQGTFPTLGFGVFYSRTESLLSRCICQLHTIARHSGSRFWRNNRHSAITSNIEDLSVSRLNDTDQADKIKSLVISS